MQFDQMGRSYFIDHANVSFVIPLFLTNTRNEQRIFDPRIYPECFNTSSSRMGNGLDFISYYSLRNSDWIQMGKPIFIDHLSHPKKTTYERPDKKKEPKESTEGESKE